MSTYLIVGMTCDGCARKVETALKSLAADASVTLNPPRVKLSGVSLEATNMALAAIGKYRATLDEETFLFSSLKVYYPLFLVMSLIAFASLTNSSLMGWMMNFMAGFYIVFGAFKLLDVPAFANSYANYDVIAKVFKPWGYAYPFIELALGFAFLFGLNMITLSWIALALSLVGAIGAIQANMSKQAIQCACLGTVFNLPMTIVTIVENLGMAVMAAWMLFLSM